MLPCSALQGHSLGLLSCHSQTTQHNHVYFILAEARDALLCGQAKLPELCQRRCNAFCFTGVTLRTSEILSAKYCCSETLFLAHRGTTPTSPSTRKRFIIAKKCVSRNFAPWLNVSWNIVKNKNKPGLFPDYSQIVSILFPDVLLRSAARNFWPMGRTFSCTEK